MAALEGVTLQDYIRSRVLPQAGELSEKEFQPIVDGIIDAYQDVLKRLSDK